MAIKVITLSVSGVSDGTAWQARFNSEADTAFIKNITGPVLSVLSPISLNNLFTIASFDGYTGPPYVTWRSTSPSGQHPTSGFSMDIWSQTFHTAIMINNSNWTSLNGQNFSLANNRHSLIYHYSNLYAPVWSIGGTLSVSAI
jgi:hypothetical protein